MLSIVRRFDPFIAALLAAVALALVFPVKGYAAHAADIVINIMIIVLFFSQGARLPRSAVLSALKHWRLHSCIFGTTYLLYPLLGVAAQWCAPTAFPQVLWVGILFLCALPSTVQSSVAYTSMAKGNVAAAVTSAAGSNIIGIALTPALLAIMLGQQSGSVVIDFSSIGKLVALLLLPFTLGQVLAHRLSDLLVRHRKWLVLNDRGVVVLAVYAAFSSATLAGTWMILGLPQLMGIVAICLALLVTVLLINWSGGGALGFNREDRIALLMCGTKKSLASGVPMANVLFHGPSMGMILLPIMLYHQIQLLVCAFLARNMGKQGQSEGW